MDTILPLSKRLFFIFCMVFFFFASLSKSSWLYQHGLISKFFHLSLNVIFFITVQPLVLWQFLMCWEFIKCFFYIYCDNHRDFVLHFVTVLHHIIGLNMMNHPYIPRMTPTWLWYVFCFLHFIFCFTETLVCQFL